MSEQDRLIQEDEQDEVVEVLKIRDGEGAEKSPLADESLEHQ